jgi:hypothetical protein
MNTIVCIAAICIIAYLVTVTLIHCFNNVWLSIMIEQSERHADRYVRKMKELK